MVDISINDFKNKVILYLKNLWKAETVKELTGIKHSWVSKWSRSEKIIVCSISKLPAVQWANTQKSLVNILTYDESLPQRVILFSLYPFIDAKKQESVQKMEDNNIEMEILDSSDLASIEEFSSLYIAKNDNNEEKAHNLLYRYLADSKSSSDIKNIILRSVIIFSLYEQKQMLVNDLQQRVKQKLRKQNISIQGILNKLVGEERVELSTLNPNLYSLSSEERRAVKKDILTNQAEKDSFAKSLEVSLQKHGIPISSESLISKLISVYKEHYGLEVSKNSSNPQFRNPTNSLRSLRSKPPRMRFLLFKLAFCHILTDMSA